VNTTNQNLAHEEKSEEMREVGAFDSLGTHTEKYYPDDGEAFEEVYEQ
jgi:hypothetical protein